MSNIYLTHEAKISDLFTQLVDEFYKRFIWGWLKYKQNLQKVNTLHIPYINGTVCLQPIMNVIWIALEREREKMKNSFSATLRHLY